MDPMARKKFAEGYYDHDGVICDGCDETISFHDCEDFDAAKEKWNEHIRTEHPEDYPDE